MDEQEIRNFLCERLQNATDAGDRIFNSRTVNLRRVELPCISVYTPNEIASDSGSILMSLEIYIFVAAGEEDDLGALSAGLKRQVKQLMKDSGADCGGGFAEVYQSKDTTFDMDGEKPTAIVRLNYQLETLDD